MFRAVLGLVLLGSAGCNRPVDPTGQWFRYTHGLSCGWEAGAQESRLEFIEGGLYKERHQFGTPDGAPSHSTAASGTWAIESNDRLVIDLSELIGPTGVPNTDERLRLAFKASLRGGQLRITLTSLGGQKVPTSQLCTATFERVPGT